MNRSTRLHVGTTSASDTRRPGAAGRAGATLFFLLWLAIPTIILVVIVRDAWKNAQTWRWPEVSCTILRSSVDDTGANGDYAFRVEYAYAAGTGADLEARPLRSSVYARGYKGASDYTEAQRLALRYPAGAKATCYFNPSNPGEAVLKRNPLTSVLIVLFPMLFIAIGAGGLWFTWRGESRAPSMTTISGGPSALEGPLSTRGAAKAASPWLLVLFFGAFAGCGGTLFVAMGKNTLNLFTANSRVAVPATVVSSRVRSHTGDDSTTYSADILYRYDFNGREYRSNRYGFMRVSSSGYDAKRRLVDRMRPGTPVTAYVNPADPTDAVLERGLTWEMLLLLIPSVFLVVGLVGMTYTTRGALRKRSESQLGSGAGSASASASASAVAARLADAGRSSPVFSPRRMPQNDTGPVPLKPRQPPAVRLLGLTIFALFWNGIVSIFVFQVAKGWRTGRGDGCLTAFMVPFVAVGIGVVVGAVHSLLALFNPRVVLVLSRSALALGESAELRWSLTGRRDRVHRLVLRLEGREEATYRQGTNTLTDKNTFFSEDVIDTTAAGGIADGHHHFALPADTMHSFSAANNRILWVLSVHGHIRGWPDVKDEYLLTVAPRAQPAPAVASQPRANEPQESPWSA